jgi:MinD superfamily P-loop ATPase
MLRVNDELCDVCGTCVGVCRTNSLLLTQHLVIDQARCVACTACVKVCPFGALALVAAPVELPNGTQGAKRGAE